MVSDDTFFAWLDGELSPEQAARVEAEVAADAELTRLAKQHRAMQSRLSSAFDPVAQAPVPETLIAALRQPESNVIHFRPRERARESRNWGSLPQWAAMAATLAIGIFVGTQVQTSPRAPVDVQGGKIYAAAALDRALDTQLASAPAGDVRIGLTFRDESGAVCRTFTQSSASGLACRDGDHWQLRGLFAAPEGQSGQYRMAAGMDANLAGLVDSTMSGEPFDAAEEKAAKDQDWR